MFDFLKKKKKVEDAIIMMEQFRNELNITFVDHVLRNLQYDRAKLGSSVSSAAMFLAVGISDAHYTIASRVTKFTLENFDLRQQHLFTGSLMYGLLVNSKNETELNNACVEYAKAYKELLGYNEITDKTQKQIKDFGLQLALLDRAARENTSDLKIQKDHKDILFQLHSTLNSFYQSAAV